MARVIITVVLEQNGDAPAGSFFRQAKERLVVSGKNLPAKASSSVWDAILELGKAYDIHIEEDEDEVMPF
jgi:hypothetical protein